MENESVGEAVGDGTADIASLTKDIDSIVCTVAQACSTALPDAVAVREGVAPLAESESSSFIVTKPQEGDYIPDRIADADDDEKNESAECEEDTVKDGSDCRVEADFPGKHTQGLFTICISSRSK